MDRHAPSSKLFPATCQVEPTGLTPFSCKDQVITITLEILSSLNQIQLL